MEKPKTNRIDCPLCSSNLARKSLNAHLFSVHGLSDSEVKVKLEEIRREKYDTLFHCSVCTYACATEKRIGMHEAKEHGIYRSARVKCIVTPCEETFPSLLHMGIHAQEEHPDSLQGVPSVIDETFRNEAELKVSVRLDVNLSLSLSLSLFLWLSHSPVKVSVRFCWVSPV